MTVRAGTEFARHLRRNHTKAEARLWAALRNRKLDGFKIRRQFPIEGYVADFVCIDAKLVVEVDGGQHAAQLAYDQRRTEVLETAGFHVLRFWNVQLDEAFEGVLDEIRRALHAGSLQVPLTRSRRMAGSTSPQ